MIARRAIMREFGTSEGAAQQAHRNMTLPPGVTTVAVTRFLTLPVNANSAPRTTVLVNQKIGHSNILRDAV
jgi:hypothetical protein